MSYDHIGCPCEHGGKCRMVRACAVDEMVSDAVYQAELKADDSHAAFVERVREALEVLEFDRTSGVNLYEAIHAIDDARFKLRAALLEVRNG